MLFAKIYIQYMSDGQVFLNINETEKFQFLQSLTV